VPCGELKCARTNETRLVGAILQTLAGMGVWRERVNTGRRAGITYGIGTGGPDILCIVKGRAVAIECKAVGGQMSAGQNAWASRWVTAGGVYQIAYSVQQAIDTVMYLREHQE